MSNRVIDLGKVAGKPSPTRRILVERQSVELCCPILQGLTATRRRAPIIVLQIQRFKERRHGNKKRPQVSRGPSGITERAVLRPLNPHQIKSRAEASIANKLRRGTFATTFFLATLAAVGREGMRLEDL